MANGFTYCVDFSVLHPTIDPRAISQAIPEFTPEIMVKAGAPRLNSHGQTIEPARIAAKSHWLAPLHDGKRMNSESVPLNDFLESRIALLEKHAAFLSEVRQDGELTLIIGWFSNGVSSGCSVGASLLRLCGELGIDLELHIYHEQN